MPWGQPHDPLSNAQTPLQGSLGQGHLSGMSPQERTNVISSVGDVASGISGLIPVVGPAYQAVTNLSNGNIKNAAINAAASIFGPLSQALPRIVKVISAADDVVSVARGATGMSSAPQNDFHRYYEQLPDDRKFSRTYLNKDQIAGYMAWATKYGYPTDPTQSPEYDLVGAYLSNMTPTMVTHEDGKQYPHLGTVSQSGKFLKAPTHPTFWKGVLGEMAHDANISIPDEVYNLTPDQALQWLNQQRTQ